MDSLCNVDSKIVYGIAGVVFVLIVIYFFTIMTKQKAQLNDAVTTSQDQEELAQLIEIRDMQTAKHNMLCGLACGVLILVVAFYTGSCVYCPRK